jgi:predicted acylesterase/phospholipase RssA
MSQTIDLVLSGGSVQGLCVHAGFLEAIEGEVDIARLATCSAGTVVGALWAIGWPAQDIWRLVNDIDFGEYLSLSLWGKAKFAWRGHVSDGEAYRKLLGELFGHRRSRETRTEMRIAVSNLTDGCLESWGWGNADLPLADAVYASSAIPGAFKPLKLGEKIYADGGVYAHFPVQLLRDHSVADQPLVGHRFDNLQVAEGDLCGLDMLWLTLDRLTDANADAGEALANIDSHLQSSIVCSTRGVRTEERFDLPKAQREYLRQLGRAAGKRALAVLPSVD